MAEVPFQGSTSHSNITVTGNDLSLVPLALTSALLHWLAIATHDSVNIWSQIFDSTETLFIDEFGSIGPRAGSIAVVLIFTDALLPFLSRSHIGDLHWVAELLREERFWIIPGACWCSCKATISIGHRLAVVDDSHILSERGIVGADIISSVWLNWAFVSARGGIPEWILGGSIYCTACH
jgi:hypothetical protein